jgi:hypothetical protein
MMIMRGVVKGADCQIGEIEAGVDGAVLMVVQMINAESKLLCLWAMEGKRSL